MMIKKYFFCLILIILASYKALAYSISPFPVQNLCATSFPTAFVSGSFSISESTVTEFAKKQSNKTMFFDLPAGWAYNTTAGTYSVSGLSVNDITAISISAISASRVTVKITTSGLTQIDLNTITVTCQIQATAAGAPGNIIRNGGTFKIGGSTAKPTTSESLGSLYAQAAMAYTSSTVAQPNTTTVGLNTIDNDIIQIQVSVTGTCAVFNVTQLNFNTDGGNATGSTSPVTDISKAKVYYTGTTGTFSPSGLFGSFNSPNGAFTITGSQALSPGTNYFWLAYDVPATAIVNNLLDAQCTSITMSGLGGVRTPATVNPVNSRTIFALVDYYSLGSANWNTLTNWSYTSGGASCGCYPNGSGNVFINPGHSVNLNITTTITNLTVYNGGTLTDNGSSSLTVNNSLYTFLSGKVTPLSPWSITGNVVLSGTGASSAASSLTVGGSLTVGAGTSLSETGASNIIIQGSLFLDGTLSSGAGGGTILMNGASAQNITASSGSSIIGTGALTLSNSAKTISSISILTVTPDIAISGAITVTNNGFVTLAGNLTGTAAGSTWTNAANSTLKIAGASLLTTGTLIANASPNTVEYNAAGNQTLNLSSSGYYNLILSNSGTKTFSAGTTSVSNLLTLSGSVIGIVGTNTLSGTGGLNMSGTTELRIAKSGVTLPELSGYSTYALIGGTVTLNQAGATTQTAAAVTYYNLKLDGGSASSVFDLSTVTAIANNLDVVTAGKITSNGILSVGGNFTHSTTGLSNLTNNMDVFGASTFSNGSFDASGKYFSTGNLTLNSGTLTSGAVNDTIEINTGDWVKNGGTFTNTNVTVSFTSSAFQQITGTSLTPFKNIVVNKGIDITSILEAVTTGSGMSMSGNLTLTNGLFKLTHASSQANFINSNAISATAGLHINGGSLTWGANGTLTNNGLFRLTSGTATVGSASGNDLTNSSTSTFDIQAGTLSVTGSLIGTGSTMSVTGGVINITIIGNTSVSGGFDLSASTNFNMTSGTIAFQNPNTNASPVDLKISSGGTKTITGGTFQIGNASTGASKTFFINSAVPIFNLTVNSFNGPTGKLLTNALTANGTITISAGGTLNANNLNIIANGDWVNDNTGTFTAGTATVTFSGTAAQTLSGTAGGTTTFNNLTINNSTAALASANITLSIPIAVSGALTLTRGYIISSSSNLLTLTAAASATSGSSSSFVAGPMKKQGSTDFIFPVGKGTKWRRVAATSLSASSDFQAEYFNAAYTNTTSLTSPLTDVSKIEYWTLDRIAGAASAKITLFWEDATASQINNCPDLTVAHWNSGTSSWEEYIGTASGTCSGTGAGSVITNSTQSSFSPFTFGSKSLSVNPLPIELLSFTAVQNGKYVDLKWSTASEINNDYFTVEKSEDAFRFETIASVDGAGNSTSVLNYAAIDTKPFEGLSYYRLKQTDFNGKYTYSSVVPVNFTAAAHFNFEIYPNPADGDNIHVAINTLKGEEVLVVVYDVNGKENYSKVIITEQSGENVFAVDPSSRLSSGMYFITATSRQEIYSKKLIVK